jgi:hypothetical protein
MLGENTTFRAFEIAYGDEIASRTGETGTPRTVNITIDNVRIEDDDGSVTEFLDEQRTRDVAHIRSTGTTSNNLVNATTRYRIHNVGKFSYDVVPGDYTVSTSVAPFEPGT